MEESAFNLFREVDKLFDTKSVNARKFYYDKRMTEYCPIENGNRSCYSDYQRINAIGTYVFMELYNTNRNLNGINDERHLSYFIMWISHILYRRFEDNTFTLNSIYDKHLKNNFGNFNYWKLLHNKKYLTNSNIAIMNVLYFLFQQILDTIKTIQTKDTQPHEYTNKALEFYLIYNKIFKHINPCGPYRELLNHLKTTYNKFIKIAKNKYANREDVLNQLIELSPKEKKSGHNFNSKGCIKIHEKLNNNTSKLIQIGNSMLKEYAEKKTQNALNSVESQDMEYYYYHDFDDDDGDDQDNEEGGDEDDDDLGTPDDTKDDLSINTDNQNLDPKQGNSTGASENGMQMNDTSANSKSPSQGEASGDKHGITPQKIENTPTPIPVSMKQTRDDNSQQSHQITDSNIPGGASTPSDSGSKGTGNIKYPQENKQGAAGGEQKDSGGDIGNGTNHQNDPNSNPLTSDTNQGNPNDGQDDKGGSDKGPSNTGGGQNDKGGPVGGSNGDQGSQGGSDSAPGASRSQIASWLSFDIGSSILGIASKGMEQLNNALDFFEKKKEQLTKVTDTIKDLYSTSVSNIKTAYDNSRNFLNSIIDNISNQPEKVDMPSSLGSSQPGSNDTGSGLPTTNDPTLPQKDSPQTPPGTPHTSLPPSDPKDQPIVPQLSQGPPGSQISDQKDQGGSQKPVPVPVTKPENSVTKVKGNGTTGIGDIYVLKEYKQIGISIIVLLIPIVLDIMYKYLYYGCGKKSKRKKNMKKVINSIGGKRQVQIIISSLNQKKQTKKSINSFNEKKSLLNIYKLMQADPIPFINLFFLLIFFVYKRKRDTIEW
ncbi:PIR protein CIR protein [Plasmodium vinckei brucechwatti]|uniref:PIR protein CIR protein n=1 Tax=Plasmodium vinckei brucechwatti TaxID=119398 RepID=A0A6V7S6Y2_PLAVN|nr:PIR protein CIR protein [Plasmodium vinckei brucechwatti]